MRCRVVSWNVHSCVGPDGAYDPDRVASVLERLDADIVGLQEVDWRHPPRAGRDQLAEIAGRLGLRAVEGPNLHDHRGHYGNGLLTRYEVRQVGRVDLALPGREPRGAIDACLVHRGRTIRTLVTHLGLRRGERREQWRRLRAAIPSMDRRDPTLLLADLNEWAPRRVFRRSLTPEPFATMVSGPTFPSRMPFLALDAILVRPRPLLCRGRIDRSAAARRASDHLPVVAELEWPAASAS